MKTHLVAIPEDLHKEIKMIAASDGEKLYVVVANAIRAYVKLVHRGQRRKEAKDAGK